MNVVISEFGKSSPMYDFLLMNDKKILWRDDL